MRSTGIYRHTCPALQRGSLLICDHTKENPHVNSQAWGSGLVMSSRPTRMAKFSLKVTEKTIEKDVPRKRDPRGL